MTAVDAYERPAALDRLLREVGPSWHLDIRSAGERVKQAYLPHLLAAPRGDVTVVRDLPYGPHPRQVLDVYRPAGARHAPVVMFVHGGAFVRGAKDINAAMYGNVLTWFARQGCVGVNVGYRLAVEAPYPEGARDVAAACDWVHRHIAAHGGDPGAIGLVGHSAGGTHVATYACDPALADVRREISALVLVSARLQADVLPVNPNAEGVRAYIGDDETLHAARAPAAHAARLEAPVLVVTARYENPLLDVYGAAFVEALGAARGTRPRHLVLPDHNHVSIMAHFNSGEERLGREMLEFIRAAAGR